MTTLHRRLQALECTTDSNAKPLPTVVPDNTPAEELERLRRGGREVYRWSDAVGLFV